MRLRPNSLAFTILLGALTALPPLSIDMGLPAFPKIGASLSASAASVGLTLSLFMAGFATAQLIFGPLSDRYGRKRVLIMGCGLFTLASAACAAAPSINALITWRFIEGAGAGAGMVLTLAIVRDLFEGSLARAQLSYVNLVMNVAPMIAPTIGARILAIANWRAIYGTLAVGGFVLALSITLGLGESLARRDVDALKPRRLIRNYARILSNKICLGYALVNAMSFGCMFTYIAGSPLVMLNVLGLSTTIYGWLFASTAFGIMIGSFLNGRLSVRGVSASRLLSVGLAIATTSSIALVLVSISGAAQLITLMPLLILNTFSRGLIGPNAIQGAIQPMPEIAGVASATVGFMQMLSGALASALIAFLYDGRSAIAMSSVMALFAIASLAAYAGLARPAAAKL
ncbi:multidrug effflux MFS transporter [Brasilonema sp. CT11]|nr:multidrug effflux MFS transporter [Brasilonema sp. CT11]